MILTIYKSSIGKKWIVALTGLVLVAYVFGHLAGNLQIFFGHEPINRYAAFLHSLGPILYGIRAFLAACFVLHIVTTIKLAQENRAARPAGYAVKTSVQSKAATKTMVISGLIVLSFVVYHLLHFTTRNVDAAAAQQWALADDAGRNHVYNMVVVGFQNPLISGFYILGVFLLSMHLSHGFSSVLQTLGLNSKGLLGPIARGGQILAWLVFAGYAIIPAASLAGFLKTKPTFGPAESHGHATPSVEAGGHATQIHAAPRGDAIQQAAPTH